MLAQVFPKFDDKHWMPGIILTSALFTGAWGYLVYTGDISTIWPLFGISNQLLAACGLIIATTMLIRMNRGKLVLLTAIPGLFMALITFWAGYLQVTGIYIPTEKYLLAALAVIVMFLMLIVFSGTLSRWKYLFSIKQTVKDTFGEDVLELVEE